VAGLSIALRIRWETRPDFYQRFSNISARFWLDADNSAKLITISLSQNFPHCAAVFAGINYQQMTSNATSGTAEVGT